MLEIWAYKSTIEGQNSVLMEIALVLLLRYYSPHELFPNNIDRKPHLGQ